jgi:hypothetical protein
MRVPDSHAKIFCGSHQSRSIEENKGEKIKREKGMDIEGKRKGAKKRKRSSRRRGKFVAPVVRLTAQVILFFLDRVES